LLALAHLGVYEGRDSTTSAAVTVGAFISVIGHLRKSGFAPASARDMF
jgi:hypothetical protein